jgi:outer membrane protein TolC
MKALKLSLTLFLLCSQSLFAQEQGSSLDTYISTLKQKEFEYDYRKNTAESSKLRDSWIAPLRLNYTYSKSEPYDDELTAQSAAIKMDQPIFQSGGIYYGIKFASANKLYSDYSIDVAKRKMIKSAISILMQIKQTELKLKAQKLQIENAEMNLAQKQEQYLSGQLDSGFLDNAIIQRNIVRSALYDIETAKERLVNQFATLSDLDYKTAHIPYLEFITQDAFLKHNIVLKQSSAKIERDNYMHNVTVAKYLPKVSVVAGYNWSDSQQQLNENVIVNNEVNYYDYGLRVTLPLDINTFRDIESVKLDYLKSKVLKEDKQRELQALFVQVFQNIANYDKKIALSNENIELYTKLSEDTMALFKAGYKTEYDVKTLKNSLQIQNLDSQRYSIDKQLELLNLYEMYVNEGK